MSVKIQNKIPNASLMVNTFPDKIRTLLNIVRKEFKIIVINVITVPSTLLTEVCCFVSVLKNRRWLVLLTEVRVQRN